MSLRREIRRLERSVDRLGSTKDFNDLYDKDIDAFLARAPRLRVLAVEAEAFRRAVEKRGGRRVASTVTEATGATGAVMLFGKMIWPLALAPVDAALAGGLTALGFGARAYLAGRNYFNKKPLARVEACQKRLGEHIAVLKARLGS